MKYKNLGNTGLKESELCLGCMTFGVPERGEHPWTLSEEQSRPLLRRALDAGINYFDTANSYSDGTSEEIVGRALKDFTRRDEAVIATKVFFPMSAGPNGRGLSRKAIFTAIDASLRRLGTDYVDLYQIHRWDYSTPIEETLEALHDVVKSGKVRYLGASSMYAWQFSKALHLARQHGWTAFVSMQNHYNLLYREEEREMMPLCIAERIAGTSMATSYTCQRSKGTARSSSKSPPSPPPTAYRRHRSHWPGLRKSLSSRQPSSARRSRSISMMPSPL